VSGLTIGLDANLMEVALIDSSAKKLWGLHVHTNQSDLLHAIGTIDFEHHTNTIDVHDLISLILHEAIRERHVHRNDVPNVVLFIIDHNAHPRSFLRALVEHEMAELSKNIIIVSVGGDGPASIEALGTDRNHVLHVPDYGHLELVKDDLLALLCK